MHSAPLGWPWKKKLCKEQHEFMWHSALPYFRIKAWAKINKKEELSILTCKEFLSKTFLVRIFEIFISRKWENSHKQSSHSIHLCWCISRHFHLFRGDFLSFLSVLIFIHAQDISKAASKIFFSSSQKKLVKIDTIRRRSESKNKFTLQNFKIFIFNFSSIKMRLKFFEFFLHILRVDFETLLMSI